MKWLVSALVLCNLGLAAYLYLDHVAGSPDGELLRQQLNADEIQVLPEPPPAPPPAPSSGACLEWRSFAAAELPRARQALAGLAQQARVSEREVATPVRWWVHIPPQGSELAMERKTRELRRLGVEDFHPNVEPGRWRYAISLGLFRSEEAARAFLEALKKKGVRSAVITEREQRITQTAFVIRGPSVEESSRLLELSARYPGTELKAVDCPT
jgi:hypothetical protein